MGGLTRGCKNAYAWERRRAPSMVKKRDMAGFVRGFVAKGYILLLHERHGAGLWVDDKMLRTGIGKW